jgi:predicted  nucleic acid-binding Zn-ribbon protein
MPSRESKESKAGARSAASAPAAAAPTRDELTSLVLLQDLDLMIREAIDPAQADAVGKLGFKTEGVAQLRAAREAVAAQVEPRILRLYEAASKRYGGRAIVPVTNRTCLGCSGLLPTGRIPDATRLVSCQSCGRILYPL